MIGEIKEKIGVGDAMQVMSFTAFAYLVAYVYEYSYLKYFGIPEDFVSVDVKTIIAAIIAIYLLAVIVWQIFEVVSALISSKYPGGNLEKLFDTHGFLFIPTIVIALVSGMPLFYKIFMIVVPFPYLWLKIIAPIFQAKEYGSYRSAQAAYIDSFVAPEVRVFKNISSKNLDFALAIFILVVYSVFASAVMGEREAAGKNDYLYDNDGFFVVRVYGDKVLLAKEKKDLPVHDLKVRNIIDIKLSSERGDSVVASEVDAK